MGIKNIIGELTLNDVAVATVDQIPEIVVKPGEGTNSLVQVTAEDSINNAYGENSVALGIDGTAGAKGYYVSYVYINDTQTGGKIYLSDTQQTPTIASVDGGVVDSNFVCAYDSTAIERYFTLVLDENFDAGATSLAKITSISNNVVEFEGYFLDGNHNKITGNYVPASLDYPVLDDFSFMLPSQANKGSCVIRDKAIAIGKSAAALGIGSIALGNNTYAMGKYTHAQGSNTAAYAYCATAEGQLTKAFGLSAHAEGYKSTASGQNSHAEGWNTQAVGDDAHAEGGGTIAQGECSHAEGYYAKATHEAAHAEGYKTNAINDNAHAEGRETTASGARAHAEGYLTSATNQQDHAEGQGTTAKGGCSHAEGTGTTASGWAAHAEGNACEAQRLGSHAEGLGTKATVDYQHVQGKWNTTGDYAHIIGGGNSDSDRKNIHTIDWDGNAWFAGGIEANNLAVNEKISIPATEAAAIEIHQTHAGHNQIEMKLTMDELTFAPGAASGEIHYNRYGVKCIDSGNYAKYQSEQMELSEYTGTLYTKATPGKLEMRANNFSGEDQPNTYLAIEGGKITLACDASFAVGLDATELSLSNLGGETYIRAHEIVTPKIKIGNFELDETKLQALLKLLETGVQTYANGDEEVY